jgi:hypothetical protein
MSKLLLVRNLREWVQTVAVGMDHLCGLVLPDQGDFDVFSAMGAFELEGNGLLHNPLGYGRKDRINVVHALVHDIQPLAQVLGI